ncbi:MAG: DUF2760 domain-containing protein [Deltaproteobacteria bacterium]|nr:DUF2760 domain-containing protein [Deltaproteobacteria bacterium]
MTERTMGFFARLLLAFWLPWKLLFDALAAARVRAALVEGEARALPSGRAEAAPEPKPDLTVAARDGALHLLAILQREGRFVDFLLEDIASLPDAQVGAAARVVQEGCKKGLEPYLRFEPVRGEDEGAPVTLEAGFDAAQVRLTGNVVGQPPFRGRLAHHGWRAADVRLPDVPAGQDPAVVAPAEVEL